MKFLAIFILGVSMLRQGYANPCAQPSWYHDKAVKDDTHIETFAKAARLSNAIQKAEHTLWSLIYTGGDTKKAFTASDFLGPRVKVYSQSKINRSIAFIYHAALSGVHKERKYQVVCGSYYVRIRLVTTTITEGLFDRDIIKELVFFMLEGKQNFVKEEIHWQRYWHRQGLSMEDRADRLIEAEALSLKLREKEEAFMQTLGVMLKESHEILDDAYLELYSIRNQAQFLKAKKDLIETISRFDITLKTAKNGANKEYEEVFRNLRELTAFEDKNAYFLLSFMHENGLGIEKNEEHAFKWLLIAEQLGMKKAARKLAIYYKEGLGTAIDFEAAISLLEKDFLQEDPQALVAKGLIYLEGGNGIEADKEKGYDALVSAADLESSRGAMELGKYYFDGAYAEKNLDEAEMWFTKAKELGAKKAAAALREIEKERKKIAKEKKKQEEEDERKRKEAE